MKTGMLSITALVLLSGCVVYVGNGHAGDRLHEERTLSLSADNLSRLVADTGAGKLDIIGEDGRELIELQASIYYYDSEDIRLSLIRRGNDAVLEAGFASSSYNGNSPYIDVVVKVPARLALTLDDGSGDTDIRGLQGDLNIEDGSGALRISGGNNAKVVDGSGELYISELQGNLVLEDGSGDADIRQVKGNVTVEDGSGDLMISDIGGVVTVDDGSGDINVNGAGGLTILDSGSGGLKINAINGPVKIND
ncbi:MULTISPECIES: DUF4097 family beta strand repeat-containing protein [unclassified Arsukibacterium]|uniref:DUF4097 family beta strand repeat-containing protein n=1 Tax=unclassified Arsukibacterium TaxID=2635278 RepID=UPI000C42DB1E|nr:MULTISPECIES: DUF4097 family beta strand repeat-containing protein [unclassified Arsukibacterium]MAA93630.1 hypothetical protein [Rheinheimera sp.]MBM33155.1 hypothetical protein [Rheinheimera sp.]HAW93782.1 hypothetical protein [Candidatus Azambacteria bacterium]|tara:strand:- start:8449 stop:9201 length:753 start_codon:yes stop_codon:yes gene_type:complete